MTNAATECFMSSPMLCKLIDLYCYYARHWFARLGGRDRTPKLDIPRAGMWAKTPQPSLRGAIATKQSMRRLRRGGCFASLHRARIARPSARNDGDAAAHAAFSHLGVGRLLQ